MAEMALSSAIAQPTVARRHVAAAVVGNALEFYDFTTYTYFAAQIGRTFFPSHSPFASLMASLMAFGVGFVGRPIGAMVIGAYGDRAGRKPAMLLSFALMGAAIVGLALTPSYAAIGPAAPLAVLILRLVQGFALGGDVGPTTSFLLEVAPPDKRGVYCALQYASQGMSTLLSGAIGVTLSRLLDAGTLQAYGWRAAFLFGAVILPIGYVIRRSVPETFHPHTAVAEPPVPAREFAGTIASGFVMLASTTICFYTLAFMTTFASQFLHMRTDVSFAAAAVFGIANMIFSPIGGWLSDLWGRKPVMVTARIVFALAAIPAFYLLVRNRDAATLLWSTFILGALSQLVSPSIVALTEALPRALRSASLGVTYAVAIAAFGGTTQLVVTELLHVTGNLMMPVYYLSVANVFGIAAMLMMRETAPVILARRGGGP